MDLPRVHRAACRPPGDAGRPPVPWRPWNAAALLSLSRGRGAGRRRPRAAGGCPPTAASPIAWAPPGPTRCPTRASRWPPTSPARPLPGVEAETLRGRRGRPPLADRPAAVLNFWYSTCLPCRKEMPAFQQVHEAVGDRVRIVGVNPLDSAERAQDFADEVGRHLRAPARPRRPGDHRPRRSPASRPRVFVGADGTILATKAGELSAEELRTRDRGAVPVVIDGAFALAFLSGVVATVNPCGFAMLPAYLSYFLGLESRAAADEPPQASLARALMVSASVSAGFLAVFTVLGFVIRAGGDGVADVIRYLSIVIGFVLIGARRGLAAGAQAGLRRRPGWTGAAARARSGPCSCSASPTRWPRSAAPSARSS